MATVAPTQNGWVFETLHAEDLKSGYFSAFCSSCKQTFRFLYSVCSSSLVVTSEGISPQTNPNLPVALRLIVSHRQFLGFTNSVQYILTILPADTDHRCYTVLISVHHVTHPNHFKKYI